MVPLRFIVFKGDILMYIFSTKGAVFHNHAELLVLIISNFKFHCHIK
jgi:hypothetical protein